MLPMTQKVNLNVRIYPTLYQFYEAVGESQQASLKQWLQNLTERIIAGDRIYIIAFYLFGS